MQSISSAENNTSGHGASSIVPSEILGWNWGAFGLNWIWGLGNGTYIALLCFIPYINLVMIFVLGAKGNEWAWRNSHWDSVEHFKRVQRKWAYASLFSVLFFLVVVIGAGIFFIIKTPVASTGASQQVTNAQIPIDMNTIGSRTQVQVTASESTLGNTTNSLNPQKTETSDDVFDLKHNPYAWYDRHNVAMAYRCYSSNCTPTQWAQSVYNNGSDSRGQVLYENALKNESTVNATFPTGLCVTEQGIKICELGYGDEMTKNTPNDTLVIRGNEFTCIDLKRRSSSNYKTKSGAPLILKSLPSGTFCVSDFGDIEINRTVEVKKYWGRILSNDSSNYYIPQTSYGTCIWTSEGGNAGVPYIHIANSNSGLDENFHAVKAFCVNGDNQVDIYTGI